eukprot:gnl/TRDRNA2_/TRDRNA2_38919_c0_seq1.p1 gnl/TRDRNA2_/TRDRNA2_38919_c0~~gnl/TRDRNA2_/TRDRNA2_38919_c0_seq1.p1  ORF type:complete len:226 (-),score=47.38 gnl/TRDRNA2_/TRDRNA2_38919_c0_seq1:94-771(-)
MALCSSNNAATEEAARLRGEFRAKHDLVELQLRQHQMRLEALESAAKQSSSVLEASAAVDGTPSSQTCRMSMLESRLEALEVLAVSTKLSAEEQDKRAQEHLLSSLIAKSERCTQAQTAALRRLEEVERQLQEQLEAGALLQGAVEDVRASQSVVESDFANVQRKLQSLIRVLTENAEGTESELRDNVASLSPVRGSARQEPAGPSDMVTPRRPLRVQGASLVDG